MTTRTASCSCGQLSVTCEGEPVRISVCHCLNCKRRSGSAFAAQARFPISDVVISGEARTFELIGDSGNGATFHFCATCGATVYYFGRPHHDLIAIPIGAFADPTFPPPHYSVYEGRMHSWVQIIGDDIERFD